MSEGRKIVIRRVEAAWEYVPKKDDYKIVTKLATQEAFQKVCDDMDDSGYDLACFQMNTHEQQNDMLSVTIIAAFRKRLTVNEFHRQEPRPDALT